MFIKMHFAPDDSAACNRTYLQQKKNSEKKRPFEREEKTDKKEERQKSSMQRFASLHCCDALAVSTAAPRHVRDHPGPTNVEVAARRAPPLSSPNRVRIKKPLMLISSTTKAQAFYSIAYTGWLKIH